MSSCRKCAAIRMRWTNHDAFASRSRGRPDARGVCRGAGRGPRAHRRAAFRVPDEDLDGEAQGRGMVGVRLRLIVVESALSIPRGAARVAARVAPALLPVVARLARQTGCPGPGPRTGPRWVLPRRGLSATRAVRDGR